MSRCCYIACYVIGGGFLLFSLISYLTWYQNLASIKYGTCDAICTPVNMTDCSTPGNPRSCMTVQLSLTIFATSFSRNYSYFYTYPSVLAFLPFCEQIITGYPTPACSYRDNGKDLSLLNNQDDPSTTAVNLDTAHLMLIYTTIVGGIIFLFAIVGTIVEECPKPADRDVEMITSTMPATMPVPTFVPRPLNEDA